MSGTRWGGAIHKIGVELEGAGWPDGTNTPGFRRDGSVRIGNDCLACEHDEECDDDCDQGPDHYHTCDHPITDVGEVASNPYLTMEGLERWLDRTWPRFSNGSCGLHVHASFRGIGTHWALAGEKFSDYALTRLREWGIEECPNDVQFRERITGRNTYCRTVDHSHGQLRGSEGRYTAFNFCAWHSHKTLECRVFPMFRGGPAIAMKAVRELVSIYQDWLAQPFFSRPITAICDDGPSPRRREVEIEIPVREPKIWERGYYGSGPRIVRRESEVVLCA